MLNTFCKKLLPVSIILATPLTISSVQAEEQRFSLEEVIVTARKREESLQDVPVAVSNITASDMKMMNLTQTADLAAVTPSLHIDTPGANSGTIAQVTIRGQVQTDNIITVDPSVGWYLDDVYLARTPGTNVSIFDLDRVEVLKGPQGTFYGRNTTGGTIKLSTTKADPSEGISGYVLGGVGNYSQEKLGGAINIPIIDDVLALRVALLSDEKNDGYQTVTLHNPLSPTLAVTGTEEAGTRDNELARVGITWLPSDRLKIRASYEKVSSDITMAGGNNSQSPGFAGDVPFGPGGSFIYASDDFYDRHLNTVNSGSADTETASATLEYAFSDTLTTKLVYGWRDIDTEFNTDIDGTAAPINQFAFPFEHYATQHSLEWQLNGSAADDSIQWVTGIYLFEEDGADFSRSGDIAGFGKGIFYNQTLSEVDNESQSMFAHIDWQLTDNLGVNAGLRYTEDDKPLRAVSQAVGFNNLPINFPVDYDGDTVVDNFIDLDGDGTPETFTPCRFSASTPNANFNDCSWSPDGNVSFDFISWTVGVDFDINDNVMTYIKAASSSRSGGQNTRGLDAATTQPFNEETATDIELGLKGQFFERLQINAAYYQTQYEDIQQSNLILHQTGLITQLVNAGEATIDGLEIETKWVVSDQLQLSASLALLDGKFKGSSNSILPAAPEEEFSLRANYVVPSDYGNWLFDINANYRGEYSLNCAAGQFCIDNFKTATTDSLTTVGARAAIDLNNGLNVALWGRNLTNEEYYHGGLALFFPGQLELSNVSFGEPRTYGLELSYSF